MRIITALLFAIGAVLVGFTTPANATCNPYYNCTGWYGDPTGSVTSDSDIMRWSYPDFPVNCSTPSDNGVKVIAAVPTGTTSSNNVSNNITRVREMFARVASIYAASTARTYGLGTNNLSVDYSPKFVTFLAGDGNCYPSISYVEFPQATLDEFPATSGGLYDQLRTLGYNATNRKYLVLEQSYGYGKDGWGGGVTDTTAGNDPDPATNPNNQGGGTVDFASMYVGKVASTWGYWNENINNIIAGMSRRVYVTAHELAHNLGAVVPAGPHSDGASHIISDGYDIMQYAETAERCTSKGALARLDCYDDDYFNINSPAWQNTWWNIARSKYLWN